MHLCTPVIFLHPKGLRSNLDPFSDDPLVVHVDAYLAFDEGRFPLKDFQKIDVFHKLYLTVVLNIQIKVK